MTPREYARLQGVSDAYRITVSDGQALFGFGDAVCVPAVEWLARHALNPLAAETMMARRRVAEVAAG
jgi:DNA (cytosine-5)-methyltransferase 1